MKSIKELKSAINSNLTIAWNDPCKIDGSNYIINFIEDIDETDFDDYMPILIKYGDGCEAEVFLHEIVYFK